MERLIRDKEIKNILGVKSDSVLWRYRRDGILPKPRKIHGVNITPESEIKEAIDRILAGKAA